MKITELMHTQLQTCRPEETLAEAAAKMLKFDLGALPVVTPENKLLGMITDRDICMCGLIEGRPMKELPVSLATSSPAWACEVGDTLNEVHAAMQTHKIHRVPVVDEEQRLVGIVGLGDIVRATNAKQRGTSPHALVQTLTAIRAPRELTPVLQEAGSGIDERPL